MILYMIFSCVLYARILPESARWLLTQGKQDRAKKEILKAAQINGRTVPENLLDKVRITNSQAFPSETKQLI